MLSTTKLSRFLLLPLALTPLLLVGCGQTGVLYLPEKPADEAVTELDVTEAGVPVDADVGPGADAGLAAGIEDSREVGLSTGMDGPGAGPVEADGTAEADGIAVDDEVLIETDDKAGP